MFTYLIYESQTINFEKILTFWVNTVPYQLFSILFIIGVCVCVCVCVCVFVCAFVSVCACVCARVCT